MEPEIVTSEILRLFSQLAGDDQDSVRLLAIENCTAVSKILSPADNRVHILPLVKSCADDKSWRVRGSVSKEFAPVTLPAPSVAPVLYCDCCWLTIIVHSAVCGGGEQRCGCVMCCCSVCVVFLVVSRLTPVGFARVPATFLRRGGNPYLVKPSCMFASVAPVALCVAVCMCAAVCWGRGVRGVVGLA